MKELATPSTAVKSSHEDTPGERDLMLSSLRVAGARARLVAHQLDTIAASLRQKAVNCDQALAWASDEKVLHWIQLGPEVRR